MKKIILILCISISAICNAKEHCSNKIEAKNYSFEINSKSYNFISYRCDDENNEFSKPAILEVKGDNVDYQLENLIGSYHSLDVQFANWNNQPALFYKHATTNNIQGYIPITIQNNRLTIDCSYVKRRLINLMETRYSYCTERKQINNIKDLNGSLALFDPRQLNSYSYFPHTDESLLHKNFDVFVGKVGDISFYQHYQSIKDYDLDKYTVIIANKDKQYHFKNIEVFQRIKELGEFEYQHMIGLDILNSNGNFTFYDMDRLSDILDNSTEKSDIHSYIQLEKVQLYEQPDFQYPTYNYLKRNDFVKILDVELDNEKLKKTNLYEIYKMRKLLWFKVSYQSEKYGEIINWVPWNAFYAD
jgi:hypothetical protein